MEAPLITTARLVVRHWRDEDLADFAAQNADARVMEFFPAPWSLEESAAALEALRAHQATHGFSVWAVELRESGRFAGSMGLKTVGVEFPIPSAVEIGWRLAPDLWGMGLATEGAFACLELGFARIGLNEIVAFTAAINVRSERVMQRIGMEFAGHFDHPAVEVGHRLRPHVLYRMTRERFARPAGERAAAGGRPIAGAVDSTAEI